MCDRSTCNHKHFCPTIFSIIHQLGASLYSSCVGNPREKLSLVTLASFSTFNNTKLQRHRPRSLLIPIDNCITRRSLGEMTFRRVFFFPQCLSNALKGRSRHTYAQNGHSRRTFIGYHEIDISYRTRRSKPNSLGFLDPN